ncbi:hypothetical protein Tco_1446432 [Tanacetum coccineum]
MSIQKKSKVADESDSTIPDPSHQTVTSTPPMITPITDFSSPKPSSLVTPPPFNTEATTITTSLQRSLHHRLQLRSLSRIKNLKESERDYQIRKGTSEEKQDPTYSSQCQQIQFTLKNIDPKECSLQTTLIRTWGKETCKQNPANYIYTMLLWNINSREDAMVGDEALHWIKPRASHKKEKTRFQVLLGQLNSIKDDEQSSKKPRESDASASKQHPALTSTGWQITDTRDAVVDSSMHRSDPESEHSEQSSDDIPMQDEGHVSDLEDTDNAHIPKVSTTTWFKPIPEGERPATPEPEWTIPPNDFPEPENNWANTYATTYQVPAENKLQRKSYDIGSFIKWFCRRTGKKKLCKADLEGPAFNLVKAFHKNSVFLQFQNDWNGHKLF